MNIKNRVVALLLLTVALSACVYKGGDREYVEPPALGAELLDLKKAYERGAIDENEYQSKREELLTAGELQTGGHK